MQKYIRLIIAFLIGITIGIFGLIYFKRLTRFSLSNEISFELNPIEIISIVINLVLAIYVSSILSKKNETQKSQKELLINYLKEFQIDFSKRTDLLLENQDFANQNTNLCFKYLRAKVHSIISIASETGMLVNEEPIAHSLKQKVTDIWTLFTDTPQKASTKANQATKDGIEALRLEKISKIEANCIELDKLIYQLAIKINEK